MLIDVLNNPRSGLSELAAQGKVLSADAQIQPFSHGGIGSVEVGFAKGGDAQQARAHLDRAIEALLKDGVSPDLVEAAKRSELAQFEFNKNSAVSLASAWSQALAWQGLDSPEAAEQRIQAVTADDVNRIAREYLRPQARVTVVLTPDANGKRPPDSSGFGGTESFAGNDKLDVPLPDWAAQALARLEMPHWTLDPTQLKLANGITLIVQPETVSKTVTVVGHVDHDAGLQEPAGQEGVGRLLAALFDYGTATLDRTAFHKALDAIAASESGGDGLQSRRAERRLRSGHAAAGRQRTASGAAAAGIRCPAADAGTDARWRAADAASTGCSARSGRACCPPAIPGCAKRRQRRSASSRRPMSGATSRTPTVPT